MVKETNIYESNIRNPNPNATVCKGDIFVCQPNICRKGNLEIVRVEKGKGEIIGIPSKNMERTLKKDPANGSRIFCEMVNESGKVVYYSIQGKGLNYANLEQKEKALSFNKCLKYVIQFACWFFAAYGLINFIF